MVFKNIQIKSAQLNMSSPSIPSAIQKLRALLTREEKLRWLGIMGFAIGTSILEVVTATLIVIFAQVLNQPETGHRYFKKLGIQDTFTSGRIIFYIALAVGGVYLIKNTIAVAEVFFQNLSIQKMHYAFKNKLLKKYSEIDYGFYLTRNSSFGNQVIGGDANLTFSAGMLPIAAIMSESIVFICLVGMIVIMNPSLAFFVFGLGALIAFVLIKYLFPMFYRFGQKHQLAGQFCYQHLNQFFSGFKDIVLLGRSEAFIDSYKTHSYTLSQVQALQAAINAVPRMFIECLFVGIFVLTIAYLCWDQETPTQMLGVLGGYLYAGFRLMPGINRMINQLNLFKASIPSIERVHSEFTSSLHKQNYENTPNLKFDSHISFKKVDFQYLNTAKNALSDISFEIKKGECIGIIGETGSGKSTLVDLLLGLLRPTAGSVTVDDIYPVNSYQWHQHIGYVPQSIYLTDDTIASNIAFGEHEIDAQRLNVAIDAAQLRGLIDKLPQGTQTLVGERGVRLSGGERQRIAIARALYRNPDVLIFDEATSALDNETEARLMETINAVSKNRTVIMIAHRLTTLKDCDRVIAMSAGGVLKITNTLISSKKII